MTQVEIYLLLMFFDVETDRKPFVEKKQKTNRMVWGVSGNKLNLKGKFMTHISFLGKTLKSKVYALQNMSNLFSSDWIKSHS